MSGLFGSLTQSLQSLTAQSRALETAGKNLANVNNADYARQRIVISERGSVITTLGAQSIGVTSTLQQLRDNLLDQQVTREIALTASLDASDKANAKAQTALGESIDRTQSSDGTYTSSATGLGSALSALFNSFQAVAANPTDLGERQTLLQQAATLTDRFNLTDSRLAQVQTDLTTQVTAATGTANSLLTTIANLNAQIGRTEINAPGSAVDLRDQREAAIEKLASQMSIETRPNANASNQTDIFVRDASGNPVDLVTGTVTNAVSFDGTQLTAGSAATPIALTGGAIKGLLATRDGTVQTLRDQINTLAGQLATSVNAAYNPTGTTGDFFQFTAGSAASTITLASGVTAAGLKTSDTSASGDNTLVQAVADLASKKFSTAGGDQIDGTFSQYYSGAVNQLGNDVSTTSSNLADQTSVETLVRQQRDSYSGVSMDEELTDLTKYQRAFQASSRVMSIIDSLLDNVINRMGA